MPRRTFSKWISAIVILAIGIGACISGLLWRIEINSPLSITQTKVFTIMPGASLRRVTRDLNEQQIIRHPNLFILWTRLRGDAHRLQAGEYLIFPQMTLRDLLEQFIKGKVKQYTFTIVDGWNFYQLMNALNRVPQLHHELVGLSPRAIMLRLGLYGQYPEGWFYPETYYYTRGDSDIKILRRAYQRMQRYLKEEMRSILSTDNLPYQSPYDVLIMASLLEKESSLPSERAIIADILIRRLQRRMRLQIDPTVIYSLGPNFQGKLSKHDLRNKSHYNTYRYRGLPPTPIAMPSGNAIQAAVHPQQNSYWYFVANGQGGHTFSMTLKGHNKAVNHYKAQKQHEKSE